MRFWSASILGFIIVSVFGMPVGAEEPDPSQPDACQDRLHAAALGETVLIHATECLGDDAVALMANAGTDVAWLYGATPATVCTVLMWWQPGSAAWYGAPCYEASRAPDNASAAPCEGLPLSGQVRLDICGPAALIAPLAPTATSADGGSEATDDPLDCLGDIAQSDAALSVEDCVEEINQLIQCPPSDDDALAGPEDCLDPIISDPLVQDVIQCANEILPDATETDSMLECEEPDNPCPAPTLVVDPLIVCGVDVCNALILPDGCQVDNPCPTPLIDLDQLIVCGVDVCNSLILPDGCRLDPCGGGQVGINDECHTVTLCPFPTHVGVLIDGSGTCVPVPDRGPCDFPEIGVKPDCHTAEPCSAEEGVGVKVDGSGPCLDLCPIPKVGIGSTCVDPVGVVLLVVGVVLGVVNNGGCRPGTTPYTSEDFTWCASSGEIAQDVIPDDEVPVGFEDDPEDDPEALLVDEELPWPELTESLVPLMEVDDQADCSDLSTTCTVVFVRGYDAFSTTGYGGYAPMTDWFTSRGYEVEQVDIYGRCVGTVNPLSHGDQGSTDAHDVWLPKGHPSGSGCSGHGEHSTDTDLRHVAYHLAWWIYNTYGTNPVDVVAHSMGGLLTRYALALVEAKNEQWPPLLAIEDVVTLGTPHRGIRWNVPTPDRQSNQMEPDSGTMKWFKASAQNPQGFGGTDWTLIGADEDSTVEESSGIGMDAQHKLWYNKNTGGHENCAYGHNEYYKDDDGDMDCSYYWTKRSSGANGHWNEGPHSIKRTWWGVTSAGY